MTSPAWLPVACVLPVLLCGEWLVRRVGFLERFSIPAPVVGGLAVSLVVLMWNLAGGGTTQFVPKVDAPWWTWLVNIEPDWLRRPTTSMSLPLLVGFFTCIGLNATWELLRRGSVPLLVFLGVAGVLGVTQNLAGVACAKLMGAHPLLGLVCGSITMFGGHATALGFTPQLEQGGLAGAGVMGAAAATLGLVAGGLMSGPVGAWLIRRHRLKAEPHPIEVLSDGTGRAVGIVGDCRALWGWRGAVVGHLLLVIVCIKAGTWLSYFLQKTGVTFPIHIGAMTVGLLLRNALDLAGQRWLRSEVIAVIGSAMLALFLTFAMMGLNLAELAGAALPMLVILAAQLVVMVLFATWITWRVMGRDYEAAVMSAGMCGFGIGNTANAVASMKALVEEHGPAPQAFLVVPLVGTLLGDLLNALNVTFFLNVLK